MADDEIHDRTWQPVLDAAGVSSHAEFHRGMSAADVSASGDRIEVVAAENLGSDRGIAAFGSPLVLRDPTSEELGEARRSCRRGRGTAVSYDAHITRAPDWGISDEMQIPLDELSAVATSAGLVATRQAGLFYAHDARESGDDASFEWADGAITVRAPDQVTLGRMIQIAEPLDAVVQGDDGGVHRHRRGRDHRELDRGYSPGPAFGNVT